MTPAENKKLVEIFERLDSQTAPEGHVLYSSEDEHYIYGIFIWEDAEEEEFKISRLDLNNDRSPEEIASEVA